MPIQRPRAQQRAPLAAPALPQITHRETIRDIGELGAAVVVKGERHGQPLLQQRCSRAGLRDQHRPGARPLERGACTAVLPLHAAPWIALTAAVSNPYALDCPDSCSLHPLSLLSIPFASPLCPTLQASTTSWALPRAPTTSASSTCTSRVSGRHMCSACLRGLRLAAALVERQHAFCSLRVRCLAAGQLAHLPACGRQTYNPRACCASAVQRPASATLESAAPPPAPQAPPPRLSSAPSTRSSASWRRARRRRCGARAPRWGATRSCDRVAAAAGARHAAPHCAACLAAKRGVAHAPTPPQYDDCTTGEGGFWVHCCLHVSFFFARRNIGQAGRRQAGRPWARRHRDTCPPPPSPPARAAAGGRIFSSTPMQGRRLDTMCAPPCGGLAARLPGSACRCPCAACLQH